MSIGAYGQVLAGHEVMAQADALELGIDRIVLPSATGGTQAGLLVGVPQATRVTGIAVAKPIDELRPAIASLVTGLGGAVEPEAIDLDDMQLGAGYGRPSEPATEAGQLIARSEGILVDPIYTAKALAGLIAGVRSGTVGRRTDRVLACGRSARSLRAARLSSRSTGR